MHFLLVGGKAEAHGPVVCVSALCPCPSSYCDGPCPLPTPPGAYAQSLCTASLFLDRFKKNHCETCWITLKTINPVFIFKEKAWYFISGLTILKPLADLGFETLLHFVFVFQGFSAKTKVLKYAVSLAPSFFGFGERCYCSCCLV